MVAETREIYGKRESEIIDMQKQKEEEELSSAALSRRAEMILANAKKRLDVSAKRWKCEWGGKLTLDRIWKETSIEREARFISHRPLPCPQFIAAVRYREKHHHLPFNGSCHRTALLRPSSDNSVTPHFKLTATKESAAKTHYHRRLKPHQLPELSFPASHWTPRQDTACRQGPIPMIVAEVFR